MYLYEQIIHEQIKRNAMNNKNEGKCGHARCAGGVLCYEKGAPMSVYAPVEQKLCSVISCMAMVYLDGHERYHNGHVVCTKHAAIIDGVTK